MAQSWCEEILQGEIELVGFAPTLLAPFQQLSG